MKPWYQSKTIWFNIIITTLAGAETSFQLLESVLPVASYKLWFFLLTVGNLFLRTISTQAIGKQS